MIWRTSATKPDRDSSLLRVLLGFLEDLKQLTTRIRRRWKDGIWEPFLDFLVTFRCYKTSVCVCFSWVTTFFIISLSILRLLTRKNNPFCYFSMGLHERSCFRDTCVESNFSQLKSMGWCRKKLNGVFNWREGIEQSIDMSTEFHRYSSKLVFFLFVFSITFFPLKK